jgi:hypothetical protein
MVAALDGERAARRGICPLQNGTQYEKVKDRRRHQGDHHRGHGTGGSMTQVVGSSARVAFHCGALGLAGALLMLTGDLLSYAHWQEMPRVEESVLGLIPARRSILLATNLQLKLSGLLGPVGAAFYLFGALHIYLRLESSSRRWATATALSFGFAIVLVGAYHALWSHYGIILQYANRQPAPPLLLLEAAESNMRFMNDAVTVPMMFALVVLLVRVAAGWSSYPRWMALVTPCLPLVIGPPLLTPIAAGVPTPYAAFLTGAYFNAVMVFYFSASLLCPNHGTEGSRSA